MKKRSIAARLGVAAMALTLVTTSLSSGTLAKYTEKFTGATTLKIAGWSTAAEIAYTDASGTAQAKPMKTEANFTAIDLADTAYRTGDSAVQADTVVDGRIAPGMSGEFTVNAYGAGKGANALPAGTDVAVDYVIYINKSGGSGPDNFTMYPDGDKTKKLTWATSGADAGNYAGPVLGWALTTGHINAGESAANATKDVTINWEWPYEPEGGGTANDTSDTTAGKKNVTHDTTQDVTYTITIVFTQSNPTATPTPNP